METSARATLAVAFLLGSDERAERASVWSQVEALRTLRHSVWGLIVTHTCTGYSVPLGPPKTTKKIKRKKT
eukprot:4283105-Amphidinium_carterae.1